MKIFIVGAGEVGKHIAARLVREGHDLVVIDRDPDRISKINDLDLLGHEHDGCNPEALAELGIAKAGLLFAVSNDDTTNILAAITARALGVQRCVVRVSARHHYSNPLLADENITLIDPEELVAQEIKGMMRVPGAVRARFFKQDRLVLLHLLLGEQSADLCGRALRDLDWPGDWKLVALRRGTRIEIPTGDTQLEPGCRLYVVGRSDRIDEILAYSRVESRRAQRVVIAGGGQVGQRLAGLLDDMDIDVTVLQRSRERAELLAGALPRASVLCGDMTDPELLAEAGVGEADYFVAATGDDSTNMVSAQLAGDAGARTLVALYNRPEFLNVMNSVRIDLPLSPRLVTAGTILRQVHGPEIVKFNLIAGGEAEAVEFAVPRRARVLSKPLKNLRFPRGAVVGAVVRGEEVYIPDGEFCFEEGDCVVVFTLEVNLPHLEKMFHGR